MHEFDRLSEGRIDLVFLLASCLLVYSEVYQWTINAQRVDIHWSSMRCAGSGRHVRGLSR